MAYEKNLVCDSKAAAADLSSYQYHAVKLTTSNTVNVISTKGGRACGILQNDPDTASTTYAQFAYQGISRAVLGGTVDEGDALCSDASGHLIKITQGYEHQIGIAMEGGVSGDIVGVKIALGHQPSGGLLMSQVTSLTAAQVIALNSTAICVADYSELVAAESIASGDAIIFKGILINEYGGSADYDQNENMTVVYETAGTTVSATGTNILNAGTDGTKTWIDAIHLDGPTTTTGLVTAAKDLNLSCSASPKSAAGDRLVKATCFFTKITPYA